MYRKNARKLPEEFLIEKRLNIVQKDDKYGLRDTTQMVWLLLPKYRHIEQHPEYSHLWVQCDQTELFGVYDTFLRDWLVPLNFQQIYHTKELGQFKVVQDGRIGHYDGNTKRLLWQSRH
jgi:hypothetical protein